MVGSTPDSGTEHTYANTPKNSFTSNFKRFLHVSLSICMLVGWGSKWSILHKAGKTICETELVRTCTTYRMKKILTYAMSNVYLIFFY